MPQMYILPSEHPVAMNSGLVSENATVSIRLWWLLANTGMLAAATTRTWTLTVGLCSAACGEAVCRGDLDGNDGKDDDVSGRQEARQ